MNTYNGFSVRNSVTAVICTILFSATCLVGAVGPARAATPAQAHTDRDAAGMMHQLPAIIPQ